MPLPRRSIPPVPVLLIATLWALIAIMWMGVIAFPWLDRLLLGLAALLAAASTAFAASLVWRDEQSRVARLRARLERRRALRASRLQRLRTETGRIDAIDAPIICTDPGGIVTVCNSAAVQIVPTKDGDPTGRPIEDLFTKGELLAMHERAASGGLARGRVRLVVGDTQRIFDVGACASGDPAARPHARAGVVITFQDVTELATAMQLKTDFVANASHELRTPLAAIRGAIETMAELGESNPQVAQRLRRMIESNASRLEELVSDLLDLSRLESPEVRVQLAAFDARAMAESLAPMFDRRCAERGLEIAFEIPPVLHKLHSDRPLIELILKNLIDNATKFARDHTRIRVRAELLDATPPGADRGVRFEVIDHGIGIPIEHQKRVFERFYQVDASRDGSLPQRGTGLGLAIVKHAVRVLGGSIGLQSIWQEGTRIWFDLPGVVPSGASDHPPHPASPDDPSHAEPESDPHSTPQ